MTPSNASAWGITVDDGTSRGAFTPYQGEASWDTDVNTLYVGDGSTAGGVPCIVVPPMQVTLDVGVVSGVTWTAMPAASTLYLGNHAHVCLVPNTEPYTQVRFSIIKMGTAGNTGATLELKYHTSFSTTVGSYSQIGQAALSVAIDTTNTLLDTGWIDIDSSAKASAIYLAIVGAGGNGVISPNFGVAQAWFRRND